MEYIHFKGLLHRDLACRNLLVSKGPEGFTIKVADFGLTRLVENYYESEAKTIPVRWTAPEVIEFNKASRASDIWAFGIVMWEIFSRGAIPYAGWGNKKVLDQVKTGYRLETPKEAPEIYGEIMHSCWMKEPMDRPSFEYIVGKFKSLDIRTSTINTVTTQYSTPIPHLSVKSETTGNNYVSTHHASDNANTFLKASIDTTHPNPSEGTYHTNVDTPTTDSNIYFN